MQHYTQHDMHHSNPHPPHPKGPTPTPRPLGWGVGHFNPFLSVVKSFESEDATILPKSATKGATPEICKKAPSKIFDDVFFLEKKFGTKKASKLGAKAPQFLPPQPFLWIIFFRYQVLVCVFFNF